MTRQPLKLGRNLKRGNLRSGFGIEVLYPGLALNDGDSGIGAIGRIDQARIRSGHVIKMHPHRNDEILTYIRAGSMLHRDTVGDEETLTSTRLMLMNAGHTFQHEEEMSGPTDLECLQIFIRPHTADLEPRVQFHDFDSASSQDEWRLIAAPNEAPLVLRAQAWIQDAHLGANTTLALPQPPILDVIRLLYVFSGKVRIGGAELNAGESLLLDDQPESIDALVTADVVLFSTDTGAPVFKGGMFSGNMLNS